MKIHGFVVNLYVVLCTWKGGGFFVFFFILKFKINKKGKIEPLFTYVFLPFAHLLPPHYATMTDFLQIVILVSVEKNNDGTLVCSQASEGDQILLYRDYSLLLAFSLLLMKYPYNYRLPDE